MSPDPSAEPTGRAAVHVLNPPPDLTSRPRASEQFRCALRWLGQALLVAQFALGLVGVVAGRLPGGAMDQFPISVHLPSVLVGALGCVPLFSLVPLITTAFPWFDRHLPGVLVLSVLLSIPGVLTALALHNSLLGAPSFIVAIASIAAPRLIARSLRPGVFIGTHR